MKTAIGKMREIVELQSKVVFSFSFNFFSACIIFHIHRKNSKKKNNVAENVIEKF